MELVGLESLSDSWLSSDLGCIIVYEPKLLGGGYSGRKALLEEVVACIGLVSIQICLLLLVGHSDTATSVSILFFVISSCYYVLGLLAFVGGLCSWMGSEAQCGGIGCIELHTSLLFPAVPNYYELAIIHCARLMDPRVFKTGK